MKKAKFYGVLLTLTLSAFSVSAAQAAVLSLVSGNGVPGGLDSQVTMLVGPASTGFAAAFTPADFAGASGGSSAFIQASTHPAYTTSLPGYAGAQWISTNSTGGGATGNANSALYAISFNLASVALTSAVLDFSAYVDNQLGDAFNQGVFVNGVAIAGSSGGSYSGAAFSLTGVDVLSLLHSGVNTLHVDAVNLGGPGGLLFGATLTTTPVPVSNILSLLGIGFLFMLMFAYKQKFYAGKLSL